MTICPECASEKIWRDGIRKTAYGDVQRYICRSCGLRFSGSSAKSLIEPKVPRQISSLPDPMKKLTKTLVGNRDITSEKTFNERALSSGENVVSQDESTHIPSVGKDLYAFHSNNRNHRIGVSKRGAKNSVVVWMEQETKTKTAGDHKQTEEDIRGYLTSFAAKQLLAGLKEKTVKARLNVLRLLHKRGADLFDSESVFKAIDKAKRYSYKLRQITEEDWAEGSKNNAAQAYKAFCDVSNITIPRHINFDKWSGRPQKLPWIPLEREIDELIAGCSRKLATFLQLLKEIGARSGEAWRLKWPDIDLEHGVVTINLPEKGSNPRQLKMSQKLIAMLNMLPKSSQRVFGDAQLHTLRKNFISQRSRIAHKLQNPRIERITFHTLRHFFATMLFHRTKNLPYVKEALGHRSITSTEIYIHLVNFEGDEYHTATSKSLREDEEILKAGFEYVTDRDGVKIYRKRK